MNFSFLSGGLLLIAIAAVWLFIFVPGVSQRTEFFSRPSSSSRTKKVRNASSRRVKNTVRAAKPVRASQSQIAAAIAQVTAESLINKGMQADAHNTQKNDRSWSPNAIPSQLFQSQVGTIETAQVAEVINFSESATRRDANNSNIDEISTETASINLDEILRRRRANG